MKAGEIVNKLKENEKLTIVDYVGRPIEYCGVTKDGRVVLSIKEPVGTCGTCGEKIFETIGGRAWCIQCNKTRNIWENLKS